MNIRKSNTQAGVRNITLSAVAVKWLRLCPRQDGAIHIPRNLRRRWDRLKVRAGILRWDQDCLRHTFASVDFRLKQNAGRTRAALGHATSEAGTLFSHYRALMSESEARLISKLTPKVVLQDAADKIIGMAPTVAEQRGPIEQPRRFSA